MRFKLVPRKFRFRVFNIIHIDYILYQQYILNHYGYTDLNMLTPHRAEPIKQKGHKPQPNWTFFHLPKWIIKKKRFGMLLTVWIIWRRLLFQNLSKHYKTSYISTISSSISKCRFNYGQWIFIGSTSWYELGRCRYSLSAH
jgi:hypothetical protein